MPNPIKELPFPWTCGKCGERAVERETLPYSTVVQYDGRGYTVEVPEFRAPRCKNCGAMVFDDSANDQITDALRRQVGLLPPERIRRNRESLGLTQRDFAGLLGVGESTVSRWETGSQIQQKSLDRLMRLFFAVPGVRKALAGPDGLAELGMEVVDEPEHGRAAFTVADLASLFPGLAQGRRDHLAFVNVELDVIERYCRSLLDDRSRTGSHGTECRRIWFVAPPRDARGSDREQADRLSELASRLDAVEEGKRGSILEEFQRLADLMANRTWSSR